MRMRKGATLLIAVAALLGAVQTASASHCGFFRFSSCSNGCSDAQSCYSSCQQQNRVCYKLAYDMAKRAERGACAHLFRRRSHRAYRPAALPRCRPRHRPATAK